MNLSERIDAAFAEVPIPKAEDILAAPYRDSEEPGEMAAEFSGKPWKALSRQTLFRRREMIIALSPIGYRSYIAAYLKACLLDDENSLPIRLTQTAT